MDPADESVRVGHELCFLSREVTLSPLLPRINCDRLITSYFWDYIAMNFEKGGALAVYGIEEIWPRFHRSPLLSRPRRSIAPRVFAST